MNAAELRLWERNSTIVIFLAILSKSFISVFLTPFSPPLGNPLLKIYLL